MSGAPFPEDHPPSQPITPVSPASERDLNPYSPPRAELPEKRPDFFGMSFGKRLLLLPFCYLLASVPAVLIWIFVLEIARHSSGRGEGFVVVTGLVAAFLPLSYGIYCWLVAPFQMDRVRRLKLAFLGVPLVAGAWFALFLGILFAICGNAFH